MKVSRIGCLSILLIAVLVVTCGPAPEVEENRSRGNTTKGRETGQPPATETPTPVGTWETVISGQLSDGDSEAGNPIGGATIVYTVLHSYFPELQEGRLNKATSDEAGAFSLTVLVHDTDRILVAVEAKGYHPYEERLTGIDLVGGKQFDIRLTTNPRDTAVRPRSTP